MLMCALVIGHATVAEAIDPERALSQYLRDRWGTDRGFPGGPVYGITQTSDGFLWIACDKGLVRFDGLKFRLFQPTGTATDPGPAVLGVASGVDGSLWARLRGPGLVRYKDGVFDDGFESVGLSESVVTAMLRGPRDQILLSTLAHGALATRPDGVTTIAPFSAMPTAALVIAMAESRDGDYWLGTRGAGLVHVRGTTVTRIMTGLPDLKINCLLPAEDGELWIGTDAGVARWNGLAITHEGVPDALTHMPMLSMLRDADGNVWMAAGDGRLLRMTRRGTSLLVERDQQAHGTVTSLFEDREKNLWLGTTQGIERWRDPMFTTFSTAEGLPSDAIGPVYVDAAQRTWFAPIDGGLYWLQDGRVHHVGEAGLDADVVYSIGGRGDEIWIGRQRGGLTRLRVQNGVVTATRFTQADGLAQDNVYAVHQTRDGAVWAGTLSAGVSRFKDGVFTNYDTTNGLSSNTVTAILESSDGTIWLGTPNGVSALAKSGWRRFADGEGLPANDVNALYEDGQHIVWAGTAAGVTPLQPGGVRVLLNVPPALRTSVLGLAEDATGSLWMTTTERVLRVRRDRLLAGQLGEGDIHEYGVSDGLLAVEGVKRNRTVVSDSRARVWFALNRGLSMADPGRIAGRSQPALVRVDHMTADGAAIDLRGASAQTAERASASARVPSGRQRLVIAYDGLNLSTPERVVFRYQLQGFDRDWSEPVSERQAVYTNLNPGHYVFEVKASNGDGVWNSVGDRLVFDVEPMFWQTMTFRIALAMFVAGIVWGFYRLRVVQVGRQLNVRFEERLAERTRIAQELHDTLLQGFLSASMQLHVAADKLPEESPAKASLGRILDLMRRVTDEGRNAVRGLRSSDSEPHDLERAFAGVQRELAIAPHTNYRVIVEGRPRRLNPVIRDEVYRIGREGVVNAFRHSGAASIEVEIQYSRHALRLCVRDDGRGIDQAVVRSGREGHWGLTGMRERAERVGASLKVHSGPEAGTEIELTVPGRVAFLPEASVSSDGSSGGRS
jgi:signal transduction histidine kinase/ligand-binding sensor domain-containing protein